MRYIMTFFWAFLLVTMLNYVAGSIANVSFNLMPGLIISLVVSVLIIILGESLPGEPTTDH